MRGYVGRRILEWSVQADDDEEEEIEASEAKLEMEKAETMQKIKDINKLENRDKDMTLYEHGENIKNNQEKGICHRPSSIVS